MVSTDDIDTNTRFATEHEADYPILSNPERNVARAYGVLRNETPTALAQRWTYYLGADHKVLLIDKEVSTGTASEDLVEKLTELAIKRR